MAHTVQPQSGIRNNPPRWRGIFGVSLMHFINDLHPTFLPTFLPHLVKSLSLSLTQAGFINFIFGSINLFVQPLAGHFADRQSKPLFAVWAPLFTAAGACLLPISTSYGMAMFFVAIMALGTSSFHPQGHGVAGLSGGDSHLATYLSYFAAAGTAGAAVSPLYAVFLADNLSASAIPLTLIPIALIAMYSYSVISKSILFPPCSSSKDPQNHRHFLKNIIKTYKTCDTLIFIAIIRDSTSQGIRVFLPLLITSRGGSIALGGTILFVFTLAGAAANLVGGKLGDRFGKMPLIIGLLSVIPLVLFPAIHASGWTAIVLFTLGGALLAASSPVTVAMAQERAPGSRSEASSLVMGVAWGVANLVALPIGKLADISGLVFALSLVSLLPWSVVLVFLVNRLLRLNR